MLYSIANAAPRNVESYGVNTLLPENIRGQAEQLVGFLEEYYNLEFLPIITILAVS